MPFFIRKKSSSKVKAKKDKKKQRPVEAPAAKRARLVEEEDEEIDSDELEDEPVAAEEPELSETELETAQEKRLRLAKLYLEEIERQERGRAESEAAERAGRSVSERLRQDVLERSQPRVRRLRCRQLQLPVTCALLSPDDRHLYNRLQGLRPHQVVPGGRKGTEDKHQGHTTHIMSMAISSDNKYLVSGDMSHLIQLWEPATLSRLHVFRGHRGAVTGLAFQRGTHQLFSASADRMVKVWSVHDRSYIESLFAPPGRRHGPGRGVAGWCSPGHRDSIDCIKLINEEHFVTGGQDGMVCLWSVAKKKPLCSVPRAHGLYPDSRQPRWVSAVGALVNSDLVASGSWDGQVRLWRCAAGFGSLAPLMALPAAGFVNALVFSASGDRLLVGCGQEHRLGRCRPRHPLVSVM
ncbi:U3 small nucleolar RNA-interacting protein 2-like [Pollicipes pollicipes]|uniref:U3 small nucleolar RNA-interacting protein 2-like n=1 Tax=Pollicipes pollicipes TaxID=41117 RepID=UPI00188498D4|nr:U3 small nucleolar RNA-interacting protein 2-like [Pollicipes pollicipes]